MELIKDLCVVFDILGSVQGTVVWDKVLLLDSPMAASAFVNSRKKKMHLQY